MAKLIKAYFATKFNPDGTTSSIRTNPLREIDCEPWVKADHTKAQELLAKHFPEGLSSSEVQFDLVQFGARALHYILAGRPAPGALPLGPNRPEDIEAAAHSYQVQWTYDDQRLPKDIKDLLEAVLAGSYISARTLREDLIAIYQKLSTLV